MNKLFTIVCISFIFIVFSSLEFNAQIKVSGIVYDNDNISLPGATIKVLKSDSSLLTGVITDVDGTFTLSLPPNTKFTLVVSYIGYPGDGKKIALEVKNENLVLKKIVLKKLGQDLDEIVVETVQTRGEQNGDTTAFNAAAFKTNTDASAEDLVKKMPGVTTDNEGLKVNGETVKRVLVDGKPFFGDDANAALKNLPAELIEKVEVFDKQSDQAAFTGFNDGEQEKTINLVTKKGKNVGQFGRVYAGAGGDEALNLRYNAGAAVNNFNNNQRISVLLLSNNVNQQNFSTSDISGAMGGSSQNQGRGRRGNDSPLLTTPQNGIATTQAAGLNYSDMWGKKINVSGSYFFNATENLAATNLERNFFTDNNQVYKQENSDRIFNQNHRLNFRMEYDIDSSNKITLVPSISFQNNDARSQLFGQNLFGDNVQLSQTNTDSKIINQAIDFSNTLLYQHKFEKIGRTISFRLRTTFSNRNNNGNYFSSNNYSDTVFSVLDQRFETESYNNRVEGRLTYTEPIAKNTQLQVTYNPSRNSSASDKATRDFNALANEYSDFNATLSNQYANIYQQQRGGLGIRYRKEKLSFNLGADAQYATLNGQQQFPVAFELNQTFKNILPNAMLNYKFSKSKNLRIYYRSGTNIPSITELQDVIDISNPLQIRSGNAALKQNFENNVFIRFGGFNAVTSRNTMLFVNANYTDNYVGNATYILQSDTMIQGLLVANGSQLTKPVNLDGFYSTRAFLVYGLPVKAIKSNLNLNGGINYNHTPSLINDVLNYSNSYAGNAGFLIASNISEKIDFSIGYTANYTVVKNTVQKRSDNNFFSQSSTLKLNYMFLDGFVIGSDVNHTVFTGLNQEFNQQFLLWNASLGYKFLKSKLLEAKISMFDILNQNRSISRTVTGAYTEDNFTNVLRRYALFTLTYTIKNFKNGTPPPVAPEEEGGGNRRGR